MRKEEIAYLRDAMKQQTIGVEIEMNHITREKAAKVAAEFFGTNQYKYTAATNGYFAWSAWDQFGREWKFMRDVSIHGDNDHKCEMVTPILYYKDIPMLQEVVRKLRKAGAISNPHNGCGVHIHIGADGHTPQSLRNLVNIMASHEELLTNALWISQHRVDQYCQVVNHDFLERLNMVKPKTMESLKQIWYEGNHATYGQDQHYNTSRYHMLNLHATFTKGTIEFRLFQFDNPTHSRKGGLHAGQLKTYIQLCLAMSARAKVVKTANPKKRAIVDTKAKYAMQQWLVQLGMCGDEFDTARRILTERLTGTYERANNVA